MQDCKVVGMHECWHDDLNIELFKDSLCWRLLHPGIMTLEETSLITNGRIFCINMYGVAVLRQLFLRTNQAL